VLHFLALSAFLTFPSLSIERWLEQLWLVYPAGMATPADGNVTTVAESEVFDITNVAAIHDETSVSRHAFL